MLESKYRRFAAHLPRLRSPRAMGLASQRRHPAGQPDDEAQPGDVEDAAAQRDGGQLRRAQVPHLRAAKGGRAGCSSQPLKQLRGRGARGAVRGVHRAVRQGLGQRASVPHALGD